MESESTCSGADGTLVVELEGAGEHLQWSWYTCSHCGDEHLYWSRRVLSLAVDRRALGTEVEPEALVGYIIEVEST